MYRLIPISKTSNIEGVGHLLEQQYQPAEVVHFLRDTLSKCVTALIIEAPYIDKDFRSTYYNFYAKKGLSYSSFCVRIHCFNYEPILSNALKISRPNGEAHDLSEGYLGFIVVRPVEVNPIGRTMLHPRAIRNFTGHVMLADQVVHLLGRRLTFRAFPYMQQHTDISVCAHVACWSILRHYSERYSRYAEYLTHDITLMTSDIDPGGLLPSRGLQIEHARTILAKGGTYPDVYEKSSLKNHDDAKFYRCLFAYVASGFPVFAAMNSREHAITVAGYGLEQGTVPRMPKRRHKNSKKLKIAYTWDYLDSLIVMDDNHPPYRKVGVAKTQQIKYTLRDIDEFIVPLPDKVFFAAEAVMAHTENLLANPGPLDFRYIKQPVIRFLLASSAGLKRHIAEHENEYPEVLFKAFMELSMPQFVWLVEVTDLTNWNKHGCNLRLVYDATANFHEEAPFFVVHDRKIAVVFDRGVTRELGVINFSKTPLLALSLYQENLHAILS